MGYDVEMVTVAATAADIGAMVPLVGFNSVLTTDSDNTSVDATNRVVTLGGVGHITAITVTVTPETGEASGNKVYTIMVYRESGPVLSNDITFDADGLTLQTGTGTGATDVPDDAFAFDSDITEYTVSVASEVVTVAVDLAHAGATFEITPADLNILDEDHQVYLTAGANTVITVTVTAEDGSTRQAYTITVYSQRSNRSDNANLSVLSLSGVSLSPAFDPRQPHTMPECVTTSMR